MLNLLLLEILKVRQQFLRFLLLGSHATFAALEPLDFLVEVLLLLGDPPFLPMKLIAPLSILRLRLGLDLDSFLFRLQQQFLVLRLRVGQQGICLLLGRTDPARRQHTTCQIGDQSPDDQSAQQSIDQ